MDVGIQPEVGRFSIGQPVSRKEDPTLLRGEGAYTDDLNLPEQLHAVFVRSGHAHGILRGVDAAEARSMPGVRAVLTAGDLGAGGVGPMPVNAAAANSDGSPTPRPRQMALAAGKVRYVGDPIACVVADTAQQARDAAEAVIADIDPLPAVTTASEAVAPGAPQIHDEAVGNVVMAFHHGDSAAVADAFARAAHVTRLSLRNSRVVVAQMEPRSAVGAFDAETGGFTLRLGCQGVWSMRNALKDTMGVATDRMRVLTGHVGGSFGMKAALYPEYPCLLLAAKQIGRPVRWTDTRSESFLSDSHGRDHETDAELALDRDGKFLAVRLRVQGNLGAYLSNSATIPSTANAVKNTVGVYATPLIEVTTTCAFTNTTPVGPYPRRRASGRQLLHGAAD